MEQRRPPDIADRTSDLRNIWKIILIVGRENRFEVSMAREYVGHMGPPFTPGIGPEGPVGIRGAWGNPRRPEGVGARSDSAPHPNYHSSLT